MAETNSSIIDLLKNEYFVQWVIDPGEESNHYWNQWLDRHPERKNDVQLCRQILLSAGYQSDLKMSTSEYNEVLENIVNYSLLSKKKDVSGRVGYKGSMAIAAAIVLLICAGIFGWGQLTNWLGEARVITRSTNAGEKLNVKLPDGTSVVLNAESEISYLPSFLSNRHVVLKGEAFFQVTRDKKNPFTVVSGEIATTVLGTSFNIQAYPEDSHCMVSVVEGKVEVNDDHGNHAFLTPSLRGVFDLSSKRLVLETFQEKVALGWKDGYLVFSRTPMKDVFLTLERWYDVDMRVSSNVDLAGDYTGSYKNASLEKVLAGVAFATGLSFKIDNKDVSVTKR